MTFDYTLHADTVILAIAILGGAWKYALGTRDSIRDLTKTVYGSDEPPVEGLVKQVERHEKVLSFSRVPVHTV